jgi:hypothetical protein
VGRRVGGGPASGLQAIDGERDVTRVGVAAASSCCAGPPLTLSVWIEVVGVRMTTASAWFALVGALGGVALTGTIGLVTAGLNHKWGEDARIQTAHEEQIRAMRDQRREVCHNYLLAANSYWLAVEQLYIKTLRGDEFDSNEHMRSAITALQDAYVYLTISSGARVRDLAGSYNQTLYAARRAGQTADETQWAELEPVTRRARADLREAMRAELGVQD